MNCNECKYLRIGEELFCDKQKKLLSDIKKCTSFKKYIKKLK